MVVDMLFIAAIAKLRGFLWDLSLMVMILSWRKKADDLCVLNHPSSVFFGADSDEGPCQGH